MTPPGLDAWSKQEDDSIKNTRGHFVQTDFVDREGLLSPAWIFQEMVFWRTWTSSAVTTITGLRRWSLDFKLQVTQLRSRVFFFYSSLLTCSIYISDHCMFYLNIFLLRAGLNSVDFLCWVGTLKGLGLICNFSTSVNTLVIDYIYKGVCSLHMHIGVNNYYAKRH